MPASHGRLGLHLELSAFCYPRLQHRLAVQVYLLRSACRSHLGLRTCGMWEQVLPSRNDFSLALDL